MTDHPTSTAAGAAPASSVVSLDPSQRAVLDAPAGTSLAVLGAPGSGKTTTLVELVAHRVAEGLAPDAVLALVPGRRAATALRDRLASRLGTATSGALARTPQSFAFEIVRAARAASGEAPPSLITGADQDAVLGQLIEGDLERGVDTGWVEPVTPEVLRLRGFRSELRDLMATMNEFDVTADELEALAPHRPVWHGAAALIRQAQDVLAWQREGAFDTPGLLLEAASTLHESGTGRGAFAALRLVVVDDAQELTEAGRRLLVALESVGVAIVGFGDPDVATSVFRGGVAELASTWRGSGEALPERLLLDRVHRSSPAVREAVAGVVGRIGTRGEARHRAAQAVAPAEPTVPSTAPAVARLRAASASDEAAAIARYLRERHLLDGIAWADMAVVARTGAAIPRLARLLARDAVPTTSPRPAPAGEDPAVQALVRLAAVAAGRVPLDAEVIEDVLRSPLFGVDSLRLRQLRRALRFEELDGGGTRAGDELLVEAVEAIGGLLTIDPEEAGPARTMERLADDRRLSRHPAVVAARRLGAALRAARRRVEAGAAADEVLFEVWDAAGVADAWRARALGDGDEARWAGAQLDAVVTLFDVAKRFVERSPDAPVGVFLDEWTARDVVDDTLARRAAGEAVTLGTPTSVVGVEFRVVVVAGVDDGVWPNLRIRDTLLGAGHLVDLVTGRDAERGLVDRRREVLDDETRMFAQAVSRARDHVLVTAVEGEDAQPSTLFRGLRAEDLDVRDLRRPLTMRALTAELRREGVRDATRRDEAAALLADLARAGADGADPAAWFGLRERTAPGPVLPPAREGEDEPVVRVRPSGIESFEECGVEWFVQQYAGQRATTPMAIGTIVHAASEYDFPSREARLGYAIERLDELPADAPWRRVHLERQVERFVGALCDYLDDRRAAGSTLLGTERRFEVDLPVAFGGERCTVRVSGSIDRIERTREDGVVVVDFKTGSQTPSKDDMQGNAQLAAYQMAYRSGAVGPARERDESTEPAPVSDRGGEIDGTLPVERAELVYVSLSTRTGSWKPAVQDPMTDADEAAFRDRVVAAAAGMIGSPGGPDAVGGDAEYRADPEQHCLQSHGGRRLCRIHIVPEVTE